MAETKGTRLQKLSRIVPVPEFCLVERGQPCSMHPDANQRYMVRSVSRLEDGKRFSAAGQLPTDGPLQSRKVPGSIRKFFTDRRMEAVIVQAFAKGDEYGVAFCFSPTRIYVEYARVFEGVTAGRVKPFVALLPTDMARYRTLQNYLTLIVNTFGPSDIEFVGIQQPEFVQVRPITRKFDIDEEMAQLKMNLQELGETAWLENDFCKVLGEKEAFSRAYSRCYFKSIERVFSDRFHRPIRMPGKPLVKIFRQYFMAGSLADQVKLGWVDFLKFSFVFPRLFAEMKTIDFPDATVEKLVECSFLLSLAYGIFPSRKIFRMRETLRAEIDSRLQRGVIKSDYALGGKLQSSMILDKNQSAWKKIDYHDATGVVVVKGDFESGPFYRYSEKNSQIPEGTIVLTRHLYPAIGRRIKKIKGIICENGSLNSHVSILAREYNVPLKIQAAIEKKIMPIKKISLEKFSASCPWSYSGFSFTSCGRKSRSTARPTEKR